MIRALKILLKSLLLFSVKKPKSWSAIRALVCAAPIAILGYIRHKFDKPEPISHEFLCKLFSSNASVIILIGSPILASIICDFYEWAGSWIRDRQRNFIPSLTLTKTLAALNSILGRKQERFGLVARRVNGNVNCSKEIFREITRPDIQIVEIVEEIWTLLTSVTEKPNLKVVLVEIENNKPVDYTGYCPRSKRPSDEILNSADSFFSHVAKTRSFQVVDDISKYISKKEKVKTKRDREKKFPVSFAKVPGAVNSGSICGFPLFHSHLNKIVYVLTIKSDFAMDITSSFRRTHVDMLNFFFDRILLEHSLKIIKNNAN